MYTVEAYFDVWYVLDPKGYQFSGPYDHKHEAVTECNAYNRGN